MDTDSRKISGRRREAQRSGRAAVLVIGLVLASLALGGAAWLLRPNPGSRPEGVEVGSAAAPDSPSATVDAVGAVTAGPQEAAELADATPRAGALLLPTRRRQTESDPLAALDPAQFAGSGQLLVRCLIPEGAAFPDRWVLRVGPAKALIGSEHAEERVLELEGGQREVALEGLPLGGYELRATAEGMNSDPMLLMLTKPNHTHLTADLRLQLAGYIRGAVLDPDGPIAGFELTLEALEGGELRSVATDALGGFLFEGVLSGDHLLFVGDPKAPLRDPIEIAFRPPSLNLRPFELPALSELELVVYDGVGLVVSGALVQGWSKGGGRIEGYTDTLGALRLRFLPAGEYTLIATDERLGRARGRAVLTPGQATRADLAFDLQ